MIAVYTGGVPEGYKVIDVKGGRAPVTNLRYTTYVLDKNLSSKTLGYLSRFENVFIYPRTGKDGKDFIDVYDEPASDAKAAILRRNALRNRSWAKSVYDSADGDDARECSRVLYMFSKNPNPFYGDEDMERMYREDVERNIRDWKKKNMDKGDRR